MLQVEGTNYIDEAETQIKKLGKKLNVMVERHWMFLVFPTFLEMLGVLSILLSLDYQKQWMMSAGFAIAGLGLILMIYRLMKIGKEFIVMLPASLIIRLGAVKPRVACLRWSDIKAIKIKQNLLGKLFHYGAVEIIRGAELYRIPFISNPNRLRVAWFRKAGEVTSDEGKQLRAYVTIAEANQTLKEAQERLKQQLQDGKQDEGID